MRQPTHSGYPHTNLKAATLLTGAQSHRTQAAGSNRDYSAIHRSVPPRNRDVLMDAYARGLDRYTSPLTRPLPGTSHTSADYVSHFRVRPTTRVKVIGFDGKRLPANQSHLSRQLDGFFPPVKLRTNSTGSAKLMTPKESPPINQEVR